MKAMWIVSLVLAALMIGGCASRAPAFSEAIDDRALVFGYIDMEEAPSGMDWLTLRQVAPPTDKPYWGVWTDEGMFFHHNLPMGSYQVDSFGGSGWNTNYEYTVPRQASRDMRVRVEEPGIHFVGAFHYDEIDTAWYKPDAYDLTRIDSPSEKDLLERLLPRAAGTIWEARIRRRLDALE